MRNPKSELDFRSFHEDQTLALFGTIWHFLALKSKNRSLSLCVTLCSGTTLPRHLGTGPRENVFAIIPKFRTGCPLVQINLTIGNRRQSPRRLKRQIRRKAQIPALC